MPRRMTYREIADDLAARIKHGDYKPGEALPSYTELARLYSVSVSTAARVYVVLNERGATYGEPGRGVFVAD